MKRRELAFFLIGLGIGFPFAFIGIADLVSVWLQRAFIVGFAKSPAALGVLLLFLPLALGCTLLYVDRRKA